MSDTLIYNTESQSFANRQEPSFKSSGHHFGKFISEMKNPVVLEIGCDVGDTADFFLRSNPNITLYSVDPYGDYVDWNGNVLTNRQERYEQVLKRFESYGDRFKLIRATSDEAVEMFEDNFFDLIFIDGLHTYEQLTKDCNNYYSKAKEGSIFSGHDYVVIEGVNRAVKEFAQKVNKEISEGEMDTWFWTK